ncbi:MAG TPA: ABC transporter substrate-binding protein [Gaiellaceae bacterium]|nr:ABC transporter substrate-binding protein [Gaiellaceae bacterium]
MDDTSYQDGAPGRLSRGALLRRGGLLAGALALGGPASAVAGRMRFAELAAGGTLKAALTGEPDSLDPAVSQIYTGAQVYDNIFSKLIDIDPRQRFYGVLATRWRQVNPRLWVFDLRPGVKFHNGEPFTAADVKYTFERILNPKTASGYAPLYTTIGRIEVVNPHRVAFHLKAPFGPFLTNLANNGEIVNRKAIESGKNAARNPVGTGPFQFVEWVQGDHVTLKRFPGYFERGKPHLDGIQFRFLPVDQSRIDALASGELDWLDAVPLQQLSALRRDPRFTYVGSRLAGIPDYLAMNVRKKPFSNKALRQAVAWALDRGEIRAVAYFGAGETGSEEVPTGSVWHDSSDPYLKGPNLDRAKALMTKAGYPNGLTVHYLGLPQYPELLKTGQVVREQLKKIGIDMRIEQVDVSVWFDRFSKGTYEITSAYQERTIDPDNFYSLVLKTGAAINATGYSNPTVDRLITRAARETNQAKRKQLYRQLRKIVFDDAPLVFAHYETLNYLMRKQVHGSTINPTLELRMGNVSM